jgi:hypothetical protein
MRSFFYDPNFNAHFIGFFMISSRLPFSKTLSELSVVYPFKAYLAIYSTFDNE